MGAIGSFIIGAVSGILGLGLASGLITNLSGDSDSKDESNTEEE